MPSRQFKRKRHQMGKTYPFSLTWQKKRRGPAPYKYHPMPAWEDKFLKRYAFDQVGPHRINRSLFPKSYKPYSSGAKFPFRTGRSSYKNKKSPLKRRLLSRYRFSGGYYKG